MKKSKYAALFGAVLGVAALIGIVPNTLKAQAPVQGTDFLINPPAVGSAVNHTMTVVGTNAKLIKGSAAQVFGVSSANASAATIYIKLYNKATIPVCGTDVPVRTILVANAANYDMPRMDYGMEFPLGLGICVTGLIADADTTATAAGAAIDIIYR